MSICDQFCWRNLILLCWTINKGSANQFWLGASTRQLSFPNVKHKILEMFPFCARGNILLPDFGPYPIPWICRWGNQWMQLQGHFPIAKQNRRVSFKNHIGHKYQFTQLNILFANNLRMMKYKKYVAISWSKAQTSFFQKKCFCRFASRCKLHIKICKWSESVQFES